MFPILIYFQVAVGPSGIFNLLYALFHMVSIFMLPMCILICGKDIPLNFTEKSCQLCDNDMEKENSIKYFRICLVSDS